MSSNSPRSGGGGEGGGESSNDKSGDRPRFFSTKAKATCWANADTVPGRHPERWRKDAAGNVVCKRFCNCQGCLCFEYDHVTPFSKVGEFHSVLIQYDGEWLKVDQEWEYEPGATGGIDVAIGTPFIEFVNKLYMVMEVDEGRYDVVVKVKYKMASKRNIPAVIKNDHDFSFFLRRNAMQPLDDPIPLCISLVDKSPVDTNQIHVSENEFLPQPYMNWEFSPNELLGEEDNRVISPHHDELETCGAQLTTPGFAEIPQPPPPPTVPTTTTRPMAAPATTRPRAAPAATRSTADPSFSQPNAPLMTVPVAPNGNRKRAAASTRFGSFQGMEGDRPDSMIYLPPPERPFEKGALFDNKIAIRNKADKYALSNQFRFKVFKSAPSLFVLKCIHGDCTWRLRAVKVADSEKFEIRTYVEEHTCKLSERKDISKQATTSALEYILKEKYSAPDSDCQPKEIIKDVRARFGFDISYHKAWRTRKNVMTKAGVTLKATRGRKKRNMGESSSLQPEPSHTQPSPANLDSS